MRQYNSVSGAGHSSSVLLSQGDMDLLRSSVMALSHSPKMHSEQQHTPTNQAADTVARIPSHPIQSMATARPSSADSDIIEDINPTAPVTLQPTVPQAAVGRVSRPLSSRAMQATVRSTVDATSISTATRQASAHAAKPASENRSISATQVVSQLGQGPGIMQQLRACVQTLDGAQAAALGKILEALELAQGQGLDITHFLVDVLNGSAPDPITSQFSPDHTSGSTPLWMSGSKSKGAMRLPRGLESRGLSAKQVSPVCKGEWRLRILASYDDAPIVGLAGVEVLSKDGSRIPLRAANLSVRNASKHDDLARLIEEPNSTTQARHMWTAVMPPVRNNVGSARRESQRLEIVISLDDQHANMPAAFALWNYNATGNSEVHGVKWMAILHGEDIRWHGIVKPGSGQANVDCVTMVKLLPDPSSEAKSLRARAASARVPSVSLTAEDSNLYPVPGRQASDPHCGSHYKQRSDSGAAAGAEALASCRLGAERSTSAALGTLFDGSGSQVAATPWQAPVATTPADGQVTPFPVPSVDATPSVASDSDPLLQGSKGLVSPVRATASVPLEVPQATLSIAEASSDELLAELQRRGIVLSVQTPVKPKQGGAEMAAPASVQADAMATHGSAANPSQHLDGTKLQMVGGSRSDVVASATANAAVQESTAAPLQPVALSESVAQSSSLGAPPITESPGIDRTKQTFDTDVVAREMVLSADSHIAAMPGLGLSISHSLSSSLDGALDVSRTGSFGTQGGAERSTGEDLCLADAVRRKTDGHGGATGPLGPLGDGTAQPRPPAFAVSPQASAPLSARGAPSAVAPGGAAQHRLDENLAGLVFEPRKAQLGCVSDGDGISDELLRKSGATTISVPPLEADVSEDGDILGEFAPRFRSNVLPEGQRRPRGWSSLLPDDGNTENRPLGAVSDLSALLAGRRGPPADLNQSLDSLAFFQRHNRSRLAEGGNSDLNKPSPFQAPPPPVPPARAPAELPVTQAHTTLIREASLHMPQRTIDASTPLVAMGAETSESQPSSWGSKQEGLAFLRHLGHVDDSMSAACTADTDVVLRHESETGSAPATLRDSSFTIPTEPCGRVLEIVISSTWGDVHYVGLSAIEVFDAQGSLVLLDDPAAQVTANPHSVNVLPESDNDPRVPENLFDGVNCTCSDLHQWLTPFTPGEAHTVRIDLGASVCLGMLRIWNYNKSRIHSLRGARNIKIRLDDVCIFQGEISQAPGSVHDAPRSAECIVFTNSDQALNAIEVHDAVYEQPAEADAEVLGYTQASQAAAPAIELVPSTVWRETSGLELERPRTSAVQHAFHSTPPGSAAGVIARVLTIEVLATWGDPSYVGMTALHVLDANGEPLALTEHDIDATPRDLNDIPGVTGHDRTLDKLLDGVDVTTDDRHMWLAPVASDDDVPLCTMTLTLAASPQRITGLSLWNYNKDLEGTLRGVGVVRVHADGHLLTPWYGVAVPKAPGVASCDFGCTLPLPTSTRAPCHDERFSCLSMALAAATPDASGTLRELEAAWSRRDHNGFLQQDCHTPLLPVGFVLKLVIWSSWGDPFYVGLSGLEVYDAASGLVNIDATRMSAEPFASVASLPNMSGDARTLDKLVNGNTSGFPAQSWLAPRPKQTTGRMGKANTVVIVFPHAVAISKLRFWNYFRHRERGVCAIDILLDDQLIYLGYLKKAAAKMDHQTILFTNSAKELAAEQSHVKCNIEEIEKDCLTLIDERQVRRKGASYGGKRAVESERPMTALVV